MDVINNQVACKYCSREFPIKQFARHLNKLHNVKYFEYVKEYWQTVSGWNLYILIKMLLH